MTFLNNGVPRTLEGDSREALASWDRLKTNGLNNQNIITLVEAAAELEKYLRMYVEFHRESKFDLGIIEVRRKDHWDQLNKKCKEDPMFRDLWQQILLLLKLEQDNIK